MISDCLIENILDLSEKEYSILQIKKEIFNLKKHPINFVYLGRKSYRPIWELQQQLHNAVKNEAIEEQGLFEGAFSYFQSIEEASDWAKTVIGSY